MLEKPKNGKESEKERTFIKGLSLLGGPGGGNAAAVDSKNGKIIRIRPLHHDWKYQPEQFNPWEIEARGTVFQPGMKALLPPHSLAYKKRIYSPNRVKYPLKRSINNTKLILMIYFKNAHPLYRCY